jgi:hypothetical protein
MKNYSITEITREAFENTVDQFFADFTESFLNKKVNSHSFGNRAVLDTGSITEFTNKNFNNLFITVTFDSGIIKKYNAKVAFVQTKTLSFVDDADSQLFNEYVEAYSDIEKVEQELLQLEAKLNAEIKAARIKAEKEAEKARKAEASYEAKKKKALADFDSMSEKVKTEATVDSNFYYTLGWLANHIGTVTAILPDYLGSAFEKYFGSETPKTLVDSRAKTSGGFAKQWSWEFKCTLKKLSDTVVPTCITEITSDYTKGIHNTSFIWNLVENYGFQFGKTQDVDKIVEHIPHEYLTSFYEGLEA